MQSHGSRVVGSDGAHMTLFAYLNAYLPPIHFENFMIPAINVDMKNLVSTKDLTVVELWLYLVIRTTIYFYPGTPKNTPPLNARSRTWNTSYLGYLLIRICLK